MWLQKIQAEWLEEHATRGEDGKWRCKKTEAVVQFAATGRSIWVRPFGGGFGEVRPVAHLFCPGCTPEAEMKLPEYGTPIYEDELLQTA